MGILAGVIGAAVLMGITADIVDLPTFSTTLLYSVLRCSASISSTIARRGATARSLHSHKLNLPLPLKSYSPRPCYGFRGSGQRDGASAT
jgi:hypothetical protein